MGTPAGEHRRRAQGADRADRAIAQAALLSCNVASLLRAAESVATDAAPPPISTAQTSRVTTQAWAVVRFYEELDAIELGVLAGSRAAPQGGLKREAAAAGVWKSVLHFNAVQINSFITTLYTIKRRKKPGPNVLYLRKRVLHYESL